MRGCARIAAVVTIGAAGVLLGGCGVPDGVDGDLANNWGALPEPVGFVPEAGVCHQFDYQESSSLVEYRPVDCEQPHLTETVHVGEFTGDAADRGSPPEPGSGAWRSGFAQCEEAAAEYLGADFRHGPFWLGVSVPTEIAWQGGARWLRCDLAELEGSELSGSLAGTLAGDSEYLLACFIAVVDDAGDWVESLDPVACDEDHDTEFVGVWRSTDSDYPDEDDDAAWRRIHAGCLSQVAEFTDVPDDADLPFRTGTIAVSMEAVDWDYGDRGYRCYLWLDGDEVDESLAGAGPDGLPIR